MAADKTEKDLLIKQLKDTIKDLTSKLKASDTVVASYVVPSVGIRKNEKGQYVVYEMMIDPVTLQVKIVNEWNKGISEMEAEHKLLEIAHLKLLTILG